MMEFKKKLKSRLYVGIIYMAIGVIMIAGTNAAKTENVFTSHFGLVIAVMGLVRIRNYRIITRNEETIKKQEIAETDERNLLIVQKARSTAFFIYILLACTVVIILSLFDMSDMGQWIAYSLFALLIIYWICYWVYRKKL